MKAFPPPEIQGEKNAWKIPISVPFSPISATPVEPGPSCEPSFTRKESPGADPRPDEAKKKSGAGGLNSSNPDKVHVKCPQKSVRKAQQTSISSRRQRGCP
ncbi:hypothetical protein CHARACLAT_000902 [Characodon lateralis]|uniref:Uncharacterized protein n=1 Tax=Characodon lateralis TaxID=208331 RepID=A0ABU7DGN6_9TELE|nr:hypothetical protein [Characodon lateralis]